jgi:hypothetical protein
MDINFKNAVKYFSKTPRKLFLLDGLGAALTTFSLYFVVRNFYDYFGMPTYILTSLSVIGLIYCAYSMTCFFLLKSNWTPFLRVISIGNLLYCVLTIVVLHFHFNNLTPLGLGYFLIEITIIVVLVYIELKVATAVKNKTQTTVL